MRFLPILLLFINSVCFAQIETGPSDAKYGSCYALCDVITYQNAEKGAKYAVFEGNDPTGIDLDTVIVMIGSPRKWVKKKSDRNCLSADPEDCLIWCIVETEPIALDTLVIVKDRTQTKQYFWKDYSSKQVRIIKSKKVWKEKICPEKINQEFINGLAKALINEGFEIDDWEEDDSFTADFLNKLNQFQKKEQLPEGALDIETLQKLNLPIGGF
jgi:hypothetical protein